MKKKILLITSVYYPSVGWIENQVQLLKEEFERRGIWVDILIRSNSKIYKNQPLNNIIVKKNILFFFIYLIRYNKKYNFIISRQYFLNSFILWIWKLFKIIRTKTYIVWDWGTTDNEIENIIKQLPLFYKIYFYIIWKNNYLICNNSDFLQSLHDNFDSQKIYKIYNWVKKSSIQNKKKKEIKNIVFIWRFDTWKWLQETLDAFEILKTKSLTLHVIWYNSKNTSLKNGKKKNIIFHWKVSWKEKDTLMNQMDLLVFPSYYQWESFWLVLYESAAINIPIITTDFWDTKKIFCNNILYVEKKNIYDLRDKIDWICKNIDTFEYDYRKVLTQVDIKNIAHLYINVL
jgi:glycosyltransferase involved in cell wall biosynthesis